MIDEIATFNRGSFHARINGRNLDFGPSPGGQFFYLTVHEPGDASNVDEHISSWDCEKRDRMLEEKYDGEKVWPRDYEKALGAWVGRLYGFTTLVLKTPDGERHISLPDNTDKEW